VSNSLCASTENKTLPTPFKKSTKRAAKPVAVINTNAVSDLHKRRQNTSDFKLLEQALDMSFDLDVEGYVESIANNHTARPIRKMVTKDLTVRQVSGVALDEQAIRSRIVGMKLRLVRHLRRLEYLRKQVKTKVLAEESAWLANNGNTAGERTALVEALLTEADDRIAELHAANEIADIVLVDIDKGGFTFTLIQKNFELEHRHKYIR
jgi:hypothetical protein